MDEISNDSSRMPANLRGNRASKEPNAEQDGTMPEWEFTMSANAATLLQFAQIFMQKTDTSIAGTAAFGTWAGVEQSRQRLRERRRDRALA
jgi:hypothetical protein